MSKKTSLAINIGIIVAASALAACGGGSDDFVSNQQQTIDGGLKVTGTPATDGNPNNGSNAGKYPVASGSYDSCFNAEAYGKCTIDYNNQRASTFFSSPYTFSQQFVDRFPAGSNGKPGGWFRIIPENKSLLLPPFDQNIDKRYSYEYPNNTFDGLTNAIRDAVINGKQTGNERYADYGKIFGYVGGNDLMLVRDVDQWGFQTIAQMIKFNNKRQIVDTTFLSVGQPLTEVSGLAEATYKGIATGSLYDKSDTFADVTAQLKLPATGPTQLTIDIYNTQITPKNLVAGYTGTQSASNLDFSRTLYWNSQNRQFQSHTKAGNVTARLYGPEAQEIGGTFNGTSKGYQGAFGAKR